MKKMAEDDYDDSFSDDSDGESPEHGQGSVELFSGYYGQGGFRAEYIYDVLEAARQVLRMNTFNALSVLS